MNELLRRIDDRSATVGVIGLGYVGLPLALVFHEAGFPVLGFDTDRKKIDALARGASYIKHIGAERVAAACARSRFEATIDFTRLGECDAVLICVPTPLGKHREPDLSFVLKSAKQISATLRMGQLIVLESTTYPGTTDDELRTRLERSGLRTPGGFLLAYSPEREDPGNPDFTTQTIPKVVGGVNPESTQVATALYQAAIKKVVPVSTARVAEASKLLENIYRSVNIALVNELKVTFDRMDINIWEVIEAASTKPFGFTPFYPGPGLGGHCIPLDPFYLSWKAAQHGMWTRFIELAGEINTSMPHYVIDRVSEALSDVKEKSIKGSKILVLGLAYKPDIDDDRESPSYELIKLLTERGAKVDYCDPYFKETRIVRKHRIRLASIPLDAEAFAGYDALLISTAHKEFKNQALYRHVDLVIDTRNAIAEDPVNGPKKVVRA